MNLEHKPDRHTNENDVIQWIRDILIRDKAKPSTNSTGLSETSLEIIRSLLPQDSVGRDRILRTVMQSIPEDILDFRVKKEICKKIDPALEVKYVIYDEALPPLRTNRGEGAINRTQYLTSLKTLGLEYSQFIMLSMGLMQTVLKEAGKPPQEGSVINEIHEMYLQTDYENAVLKLENLVERYKETLGTEVYHAFKEKVPQLVEVDRIQNYSRRYFENSLAQHFNADKESNHLSSVDKVSQYLIGMPITSPRDVEKAILSIGELEDEEAFDLYQKYTSDFGTSRLRGEKVGETFTQHPGVVTSSQPLPWDLRSERELKNKVVNRSTPPSNPRYAWEIRSAYVGSISGHSFFIAALLLKYAKAHQGDPDLSRNINDFIKTLAVTYVSRSYHSFIEVLKVFQNPELLENFKDKNVVLDIKFSAQYLENAFKDTQEYTNTLCIGQSLRQELLLSQRIKNSETLINVLNELPDKMQSQPTLLGLHVSSHIDDINELIKVLESLRSIEKVSSILKVLDPTPLNNIVSSQKDIINIIENISSAEKRSAIFKAFQSKLSALVTQGDHLLTFIQAISAANLDEAIGLFKRDSLRSIIESLTPTEVKSLPSEKQIILFSSLVENSVFENGKKVDAFVGMMSDEAQKIMIKDINKNLNNYQDSSYYQNPEVKKDLATKGKPTPAAGRRPARKPVFTATPEKNGNADETPALLPVNVLQNQGLFSHSIKRELSADPKVKKQTDLEPNAMDNTPPPQKKLIDKGQAR